MQWGNSPSQLSLLGALPKQTVSHFQSPQASDLKGMCVWRPHQLIHAIPLKGEKVAPPAVDVSLSDSLHLNSSKSLNKSQNCGFSTLLFKINFWIHTPAAMLLHPNDFFSLCMKSPLWLCCHNHAAEIRFSYSIVKWWSAESFQTHPNLYSYQDYEQLNT